MVTYLRLPQVTTAQRELLFSIWSMLPSGRRSAVQRRTGPTMSTEALPKVKLLAVSSPPQSMLSGAR